MAKKNKIRGTKRGDALMGSEGRDVVFGKNGDDVIITYGGNDKVMGGNGADVITTYAGNDKVKGGNGADTITTGTLTVTRSSMAASKKVCVPPPEQPVTPIRLVSTSGIVSRKSTARILLHVCSVRDCG